MTKYYASLIPNKYIVPNTTFIKISIDMTQQNDGLYFTEMGTHDKV